MGAAFELPAHPGMDVGAELPGPALEAAGGPVLLRPVALGHVGRVGREAVAVAAGMGGDAALPEVEFNQGVGGVQFEFLPDELVRYGVVMPLIVHVVVDMDGNRLNVDVVPGLWRQRG